MSKGGRSRQEPVRARTRLAQRLRRLLGFLFVCGLLLSLTAVAASHMVWVAGEDRLFDRVADVPATEVGLVLGCPPVIPGGHPNAYFEGRVRAAARLYHAGKVNYLLVSGDNGSQRYNEPKAMTEALVLRGVPAEKIVADPSGFRTLDSVVRAKEVFGQDAVLVVSQEFHNRRALFLAQRIGLEAVAYNAADVDRGLLARLRWREAAARVMAAVDSYILDTAPKYLGEPVEIGAGDARAEGTAGEGAV